MQPFQLKQHSNALFILAYAAKVPACFHIAVYLFGIRRHLHFLFCQEHHLQFR